MAGPLIPARPPRRTEAGSALVWVLTLVGVLGIAASAVLPERVRQLQDLEVREEAVMLARLEIALRQYIVRWQIIPGAHGWVAAVAQEAGLTPSEVRFTHPRRTVGTGGHRVYWIDPAFVPATGSDRLPYQQTGLGLNPAQTSPPGPNTRVLIVSSRHPRLPLPAGDGVVSKALFEAVWNWRLDPELRAPPAGFAAVWQGASEQLQVRCMPLADLFHEVSFERVGVQVPTANGRNLIQDSSSHLLLAGSRLDVFTLTGELLATRVVTRDEAFSQREEKSRALVHYAFEERSGSVAANAGIWGEAANGRLHNGVRLARTGPRPPAHPGHSRANLSALFDGQNDYLQAGQPLPESGSAFTCGVWLRLVGDARRDRGIMGQPGLFTLESTPLSEASSQRFFRNLVVRTTAGHRLVVPWYHPRHLWQHVTVTMDGPALRVYVNATLAGSQAAPQAPRAALGTAAGFRLGGLGRDSRDFARFLVDDLVFYDRALAPDEIARLFVGEVP